MLPMRPPWKRLLRVAGLFAGPFLVRLVCLLELRDAPFFRLLLVDARTYHETAAAMAAGTFRLEGPFWQPPFYPLFLSWIYRIAGPSPDAARLVQILLGSASCFLVFRIGDRIFGRTAAWIAWALVALCGPLIFFDLQLLGAGLVTFLLLLALDRTLAWLGGSRRRDLAGVGLALGLASITVATSLVLLPVFAAFVRFGAGGRRPWRPALLLLAVAVLPVLLVTGVNLAVSGQPVLVSYNGGINFWIGNNPDYDRTMAIRPGRAWQALTAEPLRAGVRSEAGTSSWFFRRSAGWIAGHPGEWLALLARKTRLFFRGEEAARNQEIYPFRGDSALLAALLWNRGIAFPTGLLLPLGLAGFAWLLGIGGRGGTGGEPRAPGPPRRPLSGPEAERGAARRRTLHRDDGSAAGAVAAGALLLPVMFFAYAAGVILFFVASRYRTPVLPLLALCGAPFVTWAVATARAGRWHALAAPSLLCVLFLVVANVGLPAMPRAFTSDTYADMGTFHYDQGRMDDAIPWYERALVLNPEDPEAAHNLGVIWLRKSRPEKAEPLFRRVLATWPEDVNALINLGNVYYQGGEPYRAGRYFAQAAAIQPPHPDAVRNLDLAREMAERLERERLAADPAAFLGTLEEMLRREPGNEFLRERLARLRAAWIPPAGE